MHAVDTNVLVRLVVRDDPAQVSAAEADLAADPGWACHVVLAETAWVLESVYGRTREQLVHGFRVLLDHERLTFEDERVVHNALTAFAGRRKVEFSDCLVLAIAQRAGRLPLATFDKALGALSGARRIG